RAEAAGMRALIRRAAAGLLLAACASLQARDAAPEPNTQVPKGAAWHAPSGAPDRIVASPLQQAATGFAVAWRTDAAVRSPALEIVVAGDSPDMGSPRRLQAASTPLRTE